MGLAFIRGWATRVALLATVVACAPEGPAVEVRVFGFGEGGVRLEYEATLVGSRSCAECHVEHGQWQATHRMALTGARVTAQTRDAWFSPAALARPTTWPLEAAVARAPRYGPSAQGVDLLVPGPEPRRVAVDAVFGSGAHAVGPVAFEAGRGLRELPLSFLARIDGWTQTPGQKHSPDPVGVPSAGADAEHCMGCHMTSAAWRGDRLDPEASVFGVQCERCHGPGSAHVESVARGGPFLIYNPGHLANAELVVFCAQCHRRPADLWPARVLDDEAGVVRHAGAALLLSACLRQSPPEATITCLECHSPHRNAGSAAEPERYRAVCRRCHAKPEAHHRDPAVTAAADCIPCHMPRMGSSTGQIAFTSHWIRAPALDRPAYLAVMDSAYSRALDAGHLTPAERADLLAKRGQAAAMGGDPTAALAHYRQAAALAPRYETRRAIARGLAQAGAVDEGVGVLEEAAAAEPAQSGAYADLVGLRLRERRVDAAQAVLARWAASAPGDRLLGVTLMSMGRTDEAAGLFQRAIAADPEAAAPHFYLANVRRQQGRLAEAADGYRRALALDPGSADLRVELGEVLSLSGELDDAQRSLRQALAHDPLSAAAHASLGMVLSRQGRHDEAIGHFRQALEAEPDQAKAHLGLGAALEAIGQHRLAVAHLRRSLAAAANPVTQNRLAWILATSADREVRDGVEATAIARRAAEATGYASAAVLKTLAAAQAAAGDFAGARATAQQALGLAAEDRALADELRAHLHLYGRGQAVVGDSPPTSSAAPRPRP